MLSIITLKAEKMKALKAQNKQKNSLISVVLGDLQLKKIDGEELTEVVIFDLISGYIKKNNSNIKLCKASGREKDVALYKAEIVLFEQLLTLSSLAPLTDEDILELVKELGATEMEHMGGVMQKLKSDFGGRFNPSEASALVRKSLK